MTDHILNPPASIDDLSDIGNLIGRMVDGKLAWRPNLPESTDSLKAVENVGDYPNFGSLPAPDPARPLDIATITRTDGQIELYHQSSDGTQWVLDAEALVVDDATKDALILNDAQFNARKEVLYRSPSGDLQNFRPREAVDVTAWTALGATFADKFQPIGDKAEGSYENVALLPDPATVISGDQAVIFNDPDELNNGNYVATGPMGAPADNWVN